MAKRHPRHSALPIPPPSCVGRTPQILLGPHLPLKQHPRTDDAEPKAKQVESSSSWIDEANERGSNSSGKKIFLSSSSSVGLLPPFAVSCLTMLPDDSSSLFERPKRSHDPAAATKSRFSSSPSPPAWELLRPLMTMHTTRTATAEAIPCTLEQMCEQQRGPT